MTTRYLLQRAWRGLIFMHRWLGIFACLVFAMWFVSGLVMIYVGFPELTRVERVAGLPRIDWNAVKIDPQLALKLSVMDEFPREIRLDMAGSEPVYRIQGRSFEGDPVRYVISASSGEFIQHVDEQQALATARAFSKSSHAKLNATIKRDQWTVAGSFDSHRPMYRVDVMDDAGSQLYVSSHTGEVVLDTTRHERAWNYFGAVIHWLYFTELRANESLWRQVVLWASGVGIVVAIAGMWIGIVVVRVRKRYPTGSISPYRGWMKWHHIAGFIGGVFVLTWIFSGWMSMGPPVPWEHARPARLNLHDYAGNTSPRFELTQVARERLASLDVRQVEFGWIAGQQFIWATDSTGMIRTMNNVGDAIVQNVDATATAIAKLLPSHRLVSTTLIEQEDAYWYSHHNQRQLPVLRAVFDDPAHTWIHVNPATGKMVGRLDDADRANRWLFSALHRLDFYWLLNYRPLWDAAMWALSLAGLFVSISGVVIGWRRLKRTAQ
jgi:uncharacterized iron-regulated membrane protein